MDAFRTNWTFIKVETDEGLCGWGEASLGTREHALEGCVEDMKRLIVGRNPIGIEIACWDIAGKFYNAPVCNLLGGRLREQVPMYANAWFTGARTPEQFAEKARYTVSKGVKALKWDPFGKAHMTLSRREMDAAVACVGAVREAVGPEVELLIECHGRFNHYTAVEMSRELAPFKPMFIEEPTVPDCIDSLRWVRDHSQVPVAAGERFYGKYAFWDVLHKEAIDIAQPDIFHNGGILESKKVAAMCESCHVPVSFHNPSGPVSNAAILQLAACTPNFLIHEIMITDGSFRADVTDEEVRYQDGFILVPDKPGLGIEVNEAFLSTRPYVPRNLRHYTGTLTDIRPKDDTVYYFKGWD